MATTSSVTSNNNATISSASASAKAASAVIQKLGTGSGIDTKTLASALVDADRAPKQNALNNTISKSNGVVSGLAAIKYIVTNLQTAFADLKDQTDFSNVITSTSTPSAFTATAGATAVAGNHDIIINSLASPQRNVGSGFASSTTVVNGSSFTLTLGGTGFPQVSGSDQTISVTTPTPAGIVAAINASGKGLNAQLMNTGAADSPYKIVVTGASGSDNAFTISSSVAAVDFDTSLQIAANASLSVDGVAISSDSNQVSDAITGVTLNLVGTTSGATLSMSRDTSVVKTKVLALVSAYNDAMDVLATVADPASTVADWGGKMSGNSTVNLIKNQLRELVTSDSSTSSGTITALRDMGVEINSSGKLTTNSVKLDLALMFNFDDTVTAFSGNQQDQSVYSSVDAGIAGDAYKSLATMLSSTSTIALETKNANTRINKAQDDLAKLEERMTQLLARYTKQFAAMDSMVGQTTATRTGLTSSFAGLMATYTKN